MKVIFGSEPALQRGCAEVALSLHLGNEFFLFQMAGCLAELVFRCFTAQMNI